MNKSAEIEALLFISGEEGISLEELAYLLECTTADTYQLLEQIKNDYHSNEKRGLEILEVGNQFLLASKKECVSVIKKYAHSPVSQTLSQAALETLAIIAYKQPITRSQIDEIRGVQSSGSVQKLMNKRLIQEKGRLDRPGRPILYGTSDYFMDYFGLRTIQELPSVEDMETEMKELPTDLFFERFKEQLDFFEEDDTSREVKTEGDSE